jgi:hypothetical protein
MMTMMTMGITTLQPVGAILSIETTGQSGTYIYIYIFRTVHDPCRLATWSQHNRNPETVCKPGLPSVPQFLGQFVSKTTLWRKENGTPKGVILTISNPLLSYLNIALTLTMNPLVLRLMNSEYSKCDLAAFDVFLTYFLKAPLFRLSPCRMSFHDAFSKGVSHAFLPP